MYYHSPTIMIISSPDIMVNHTWQAKRLWTVRWWMDSFYIIDGKRLKYSFASKRGWPKYGAFLKYWVPPKSSNIYVVSMGKPMVFGGPHILGDFHIYDLEQKGEQVCFIVLQQECKLQIIPYSCFTQTSVNASTYVNWCTSGVAYFCKSGVVIIFYTVFEDSPTW